MNWHKKIIKLSAAKNKINSLGIVDPSLKFFINKYEDLVGKDWNNFKSPQDVQGYIAKNLIPILKDKIDPTSNENNYLKPQDVDIPQEYKQNPEDPVLAQVYQAYQRDPARATASYLEHLNYDKKNSFEKWWSYLNSEEPYRSNPAFIYSILKPIIDSSPESTKAGPPPLNSEALAMIWEEINTQNVTQMNVVKKYNKISSKLDKEGIQAIETSGGNEWIRIPSKISDPKHYQENLQKLQRFSQGSGWCIARDYHSNAYLSKGDFWLYLVGGKPVVAIRLIGNDVQEIRGLNNDIKKLEPYWQEVIAFLDKTNFEYRGNEQYKHLQKIYLMNANLEKGSNNYNTVMDMIRKDHNAYMQLSDSNKKKFPEFLEIAKQGYAKEIDKILVNMERPGLTPNQYMGIFENFQDYYNSIPPEVKDALGNMKPRIIEAHKKAFHNNPIILTEFSPEMQQMFSLQDQMSAWKNYVDQDPYHYNDSRIPLEIRKHFSPEFLKEEWDKLLESNSEHIDHIPPELKKLWNKGELGQYILRDLIKYPVSRVNGRFDKIDRAERAISEGIISRPQMIEILTNSIRRNPKWMSILPKNYQDEIMATGGNIGNIIQREQGSRIVKDVGYFKGLSLEQQNALLQQQGNIIGEAFAREKNKYHGMLHDFWTETPPNVREYLPDNVILEVAQYYADLLKNNPNNFNDIFSKIPVDIQPVVFSKMSSGNNWYKRAMMI